MKNRILFSRIGAAVILAFFLALAFGCAGMKKTGAEPASVTIAPASGVKGTAITISGEGFYPEEEIDIILTLGPGELIGLGTRTQDVVMSDATGSFTAESAIPVFAKPGRYVVEVEGSKGSLVETTLEVTSQ